jgi:two-component system cell cycle sensor histidine kinase/response regulator CckA
MHQLLAFSRQQVLQPRVFQLSALVSESTRMMQRLIGEDIQMKIVETSNLGKIKADPGQIEQVILNLEVNARDAMPQGGKLTLELANSQHTGAEPGNYVVLRVTDTGMGMDEETLVHIFEPFYTTKETGKGTGLGLSMVYGIVKQSGGYILVNSRVGKGTTFHVYLPRVHEDAPCAEDLDTSKLKNGRENILLVEDDEAVRELAREILTARGYAVTSVAGPKQAIEICAYDGKPVDLLIADAVMPEMSGREMAVKLSRLRPGIRILMMSGYTHPQVGQAQVADHIVGFLQKPFKNCSNELNLTSI